MKRFCVAGLTTLAAVAAVTMGGGAATASTATADVGAYLRPTSPGAQCSIGVTNFGPDTVNIGLGPSNSFQKVYYRDIGPLAPGASATVDYAVKCEPASGNGPLLIAAFGYATDGSGQATDLNPLNNYVIFF